MHYRRKRLYGDPDAVAWERAAEGDPRALLELVLRMDTDECVLWPFGKRRGYGAIRWDGRQRSVHVLACEAAHGPRPPDKAHAAHRCGVRACFNPRHVRWATPAENEADKRR